MLRLFAYMAGLAVLAALPRVSSGCRPSSPRSAPRRRGRNGSRSSGPVRPSKAHCLSSAGRPALRHLPPRCRWRAQGRAELGGADGRRALCHHRDLPSGRPGRRFLDPLSEVAARLIGSHRHRRRQGGRRDRRASSAGAARRFRHCAGGRGTPLPRLRHALRRSCGADRRLVLQRRKTRWSTAPCLACALDRLSILSAGGDAKVAELFARAELKRSYCGRRNPILAATPEGRQHAASSRIGEAARTPAAVATPIRAQSQARGLSSEIMRIAMPRVPSDRQGRAKRASPARGRKYLTTAERLIARQRKPVTLRAEQARRHACNCR